MSACQSSDIQIATPTSSVTFLKAAFMVASTMFTSSSGVERSISGGSEVAPREYPSPATSGNSMFGFLIGGRLV